jgi:hypothetical protein
LKQIFVCGHCGKPLTGRMQIHPVSKERTPVYVCQSYVRGKANGHKSPCGYHRIPHADAEKLLLDKLAELNLPLDETVGGSARANLDAQKKRVGDARDDIRQQLWDWEAEFNETLKTYLPELGPGTPGYPPLFMLYWGFVSGLWGPDTEKHKEAVQEALSAAAREAKAKLAELEAERVKLARDWARAPEAIQDVLKADIERLVAEMKHWERRTVPLRQRLDAILAEEAARKAEWEKIQSEYPALDGREKGEALRRVFDTVTLYWEATWHPNESRSRNGKRPRKTSRPGRYSYELQKDKIEWGYAASNVLSSCGTGEGTRLPPRWFGPVSSRPAPRSRGRSRPCPPDPPGPGPSGSCPGSCPGTPR